MKCPVNTLYIVRTQSKISVQEKHQKNEKQLKCFSPTGHRRSAKQSRKINSSETFESPDIIRRLRSQQQQNYLKQNLCLCTVITVKYNSYMK